MATTVDIAKYIEFGNRGIKDGNVRRARAWFKKAVRAAPNNAVALDGLAWTYYLEDRHEIAKHLLIRAIKADPGFAEAYTDLGCVMQALRRYDAAERLHKRCLALEPGRHDAHLNLGALYICQKRFADAEEVLTRAVECEPDAASYQLLGEAQMQRLDFGAACASLHACLALDNTNIEADLLLTYALMERGPAARAADVVRDEG